MLTEITNQIFFRRLCLLFHPDKGGSNAAMRDLLEARKLIGGEFFL